jgi:hypothetical protein
MPGMLTMPRPWSTFSDKAALPTSYNGLNALPDGTIVVKSLYRVGGCDKNGPSALLTCTNSGNVPASNLISINPHTLCS